MLLCETIRRVPLVPPPKLIARVRGILVLSVVPDWQGPLRLLVHQRGRRTQAIWMAEARAHCYYQVDFKIFPHGGQALSAAGGTFVLSGEFGVCGCCTPAWDLFQHYGRCVSPSPELQPYYDVEEDAVHQPSNRVEECWD